MKSKHNDEEAEKENSERWLLTYSDLITLLLALFIILYTMSTVDLEKMKQLSKNLKGVFNPNATSEDSGAGGPGSGVDDVSGGGESSLTDSGSSGGDSNTKNPLDEIYNELTAYVKNNNLQNQIELENTDTYVKVTVKDVLLFVPDSPQMLEQSKPIMLEINKALNSVYSRIDHITIGGHTADPIGEGDKSSDFDWTLSSARALTVLKYLAASGLPQPKLSTEAHSHFEPIADNKTPEGRAKNRRVEITIIKNQPTPAK